MSSSPDQRGPDSAKTERVFRPMRHPLLVFLCFASYIGFGLLNVIWPEALKREEIPLGKMELSLHDLNLAVTMGFGVMFLMILLALTYAWPRRAEPN